MTTSIKTMHEKKTIELSKGFAKKAEIFNSEEYNLLLKATRDFPTYSIEVKKTTTPKHHSGLKGLTYDYMDRYIDQKGSEEQQAIYQSKRNPSDLAIKRESYVGIKKWFLEQFPEILGNQQSAPSVQAQQSA